MKQPVRKFKETVEIRTQVLYRLRSHRYYPIVLVVTCLLLAGSVHIWQRVKVMSLVKETAQLRAENAGLVDDAIKYEAQIASLLSAGRIMSYAEDTLGMKPVKAENLYTLASNEEDRIPPDELALMKRALERIADHMPSLTESQATAGSLRQIAVDSLLRNGERR
ncbi:MAG TPA: hypothetical protein PLF13_09730 [candidate division Zixibacteria bacterium]|nr:hypothetical protein [candidate division Zixibacteria bacterium]